MKTKIKTSKIIRSPLKQKILLLLQAGAALSLTRSFNKQRSILRQLGREWKFIDRRYLYQLLREFHDQRLVDWREQDDGTIRLILSERGEKKILQFDIDRLKIPKPNSWDRKWHVVFFDVPEKRRPIRDALRRKLQEIGFYELQKSVFVYPYPCFKEINFIVEFFEARRFVRYGELNNLTNDAGLKLHFKLSQ